MLYNQINFKPICFFLKIEVTCQYQECQYNNWSPWSQTCGSTARTRDLKMAYDRTKTQHGGCSGLQTSCNKLEKEEKTLDVCPRMYFFLFSVQSSFFKRIENSNDSFLIDS